MRGMKPLKPLRGVRVLSLALNLPGPAALLRLHAMGARCTKLEAPAPVGASSGDPMAQYSPTAYQALHRGIRRVVTNLKTDEGQAKLRKLLETTDVLLTSFRPSALRKLGLEWKTLRKSYPALSMVTIVGSPGERAEEPGHDLTYLADAGLISGLSMPPTLFADMGGALLASEAVLQATLAAKNSGKGSLQEVALSDAAAWLALPRTWGLTLPDAAVGGAHAGYRIYPCKDGRVAMAALEPHFALALCQAANVKITAYATMFEPATHDAIAAFVAGKTRRQLERLAVQKDIPLHALPA